MNKLTSQALLKKIKASRGSEDDYFQLATFYKNNNNLKESTLILKHGLEYHPKSKLIHNYLGEIYGNLKDVEQAVFHYKASLQLNNQQYKIHNNLANSFNQLKRLNLAELHYKISLKLKSGQVGVINNLASLLVKKEKYQEAKKYFIQSLSLNGRNIHVYYDFGRLFWKMGCAKEAFDCFRKALLLQPSEFVIYSQFLLIANCIIADQEQLYQLHCEWKTLFSKAQQLGRTLPRVVSGFISSTRETPSSLSQGLAPEISHFKSDCSINNEKPNKKIIIGFVSADFKRHSVAYFVQAIFLKYSREKYQLILYADVSQEDTVSTEIKSMVDGWRNISGKDNEFVYKLIKKDSIDILFDLSGHTYKNRLAIFLNKAAPIQISYLGYPNTTGLEEIAYRLTDAVSETKDSHKFHSEKLIKLPGCFLCYTADKLSPPVNRLPALTQNEIVFGSFNNLVKVTDEVLELWAKILKEIPKSKLLLKAGGLASTEVKHFYQEKFIQLGIAANRIQLMGHLNAYQEHLAVYQQVDIALDSFPYNGTTTTCEALWMGVPVISFVGNRHAARVGLSLLSSLGLEEYAAQSKLDYLSIAKNLSKDTTKLQQLRMTLREKMQQSELMNSDSFCKKFFNVIDSIYSLDPL